jgi:hypothetical protein
MKGNLTGPEGVLMLCAAGILDGIGFALFLLSWLGIDDYGILDVLGMLIIGGWMFLRGGGLNKKIIKRGLRRFTVATIIELIPFIGGIAPSWTILVWKELKSSEEKKPGESDDPGKAQKKESKNQLEKLRPQSAKT